ncbi:sugar transferase [Pontibaca salina]|uniref:Sugar transferase n=1 Tax=Pontibaca salina TaxID=2795731 RepID=A0A934LYX0_9RHOB|nr:sugar transferase [Pontibaca salina]MBI6630252.1 sugar transferase [Pontibaca salina]
MEKKLDSGQVFDDTRECEPGALDPAASAQQGLYRTTKRIFDITFSLAMLMPLLLLCGIVFGLNMFWNPGPLFFRQLRKGKDGKGFMIIKFRSMAPTDKRTRYADDPLETSRVTPLGHILRASEMDELPQIFNILMGEMSLVGPRPEIFEFAETYESFIPNYAMREAVRPGVTGYAQVMQGYTDTIEMVRRKTELDLHYVRNMSWRFDLRILIKTVALVFHLPKIR